MTYEKLFIPVYYKINYVYRPVHRCFFTSDNYHIASFSDDKTVNVWDIASETKVYSYNEHTVSVEVNNPQKIFIGTW